MTQEIRQQFSEQEWKQIVAAAPMAGLVVMSASPHGPIGVLKEAFSVGMAMADIVREGSSNALIQALIDDVKARQTRPEAPQGLRDAEQARKAALEQLAAVARVVDQKAPQDAAGFKQWLMQVGQRVAEASNEGGFFGFGGTRVSDDEKAALASMAQTLGVAGGAGGAGGTQTQPGTASQPGMQAQSGMGSQPGSQGQSGAASQSGSQPQSGMGSQSGSQGQSGTQPPAAGGTTRT